MVFDDGTFSRDAIQIADLLIDVTTKQKVHGTLTVGVTEEAIPLGDIAAPKWAIFVNRGTTGSIALRTGAGVAPFHTIGPGEFSIGPLPTTVTAPYCYGSAAGCRLEYMIVDT